jgi:hypothetical protein
MSLQDLGAIGEVVGGIAVVVSLVYVAYQVRQSTRQIEQNSRHLEASMYHATNDAFFRWFALLAQDAGLAALWNRALAGETLSHDETTRVNSLIAMLFTCYENNFQQIRFGAMTRDTLEIARHDLSRLMSRPVIQTWWKRHGLGTLTPEFRQAVESLVSKVNSAKDAAQQDAAAVEPQRASIGLL